MYVLRSREQIELQLRTELEAAEQRFQQATPEQLPDASTHFKEALHRFTVLVLYGEVPRELWWA